MRIHTRPGALPESRVPPRIHPRGRGRAPALCFPLPHEEVTRGALVTVSERDPAGSVHGRILIYVSPFAAGRLVVVVEVIGLARPRTPRPGAARTPADWHG
ncbi:hypothetical protein GCM10009831_12180 [Dietzia cercidiphylli]|uniref:TRAM domain-containing protein n=1 Tax=Dietzia cercidiphylli TaxID=498199 RepID=A0ABN2IFK7_9ACTN